MKLEPNFSNLLKDVVNRNEKKTRGNLYVFLICLGISVFIWFLIALSNESYTSLHYPVKFVNHPQDMVLVNQPDSIITFRISSGGFELFTLRYLTRKSPIEIDLANLHLDGQSDFLEGSYSTSRLIPDIRKKYKFSEELISISPEIIYFSFEPLTGRMVPVVSEMKMEFQKQFRLSDTIEFEPAMVKVVGPRNLIDQIQHINTVSKAISNIEGEVKGSVDLEKPFGHEQLTIIPDVVEYTLTSEKYTESSIEVPVHGQKEDVMIKTFPENIKVTFLVSLANFNRVDVEMFSAVIDIPAQSGGREKAKIRLVRVPVFVEVIRIEPEEVDFLVLKQ